MINRLPLSQLPSSNSTGPDQQQLPAAICGNVIVACGSFLKTAKDDYYYFITNVQPACSGRISVDGYEVQAVGKDWDIHKTITVVTHPNFGVRFFIFV